jgi:hypothetical protein
LNSRMEYQILVATEVLANRRINPMTDHNSDSTEEDILINDVTDEAIEAAAGIMKERAGTLTLAFCSGLDTCPA